MTHLVALALCLAGFLAIALGVKRQQRDILGRSLRPATVQGLRAAGSCSLLCALAVLIAWRGYGLGFVMFSGHTSLSAGAVYCALIGVGLGRRWRG